MPTKSLHPISSSQQDWLQVPSDGSPHYTKIAEPVANADGATTVLRTKSALRAEQFKFEAVPDNFSSLNSLEIAIVASADRTGVEFDLVLKVDFYVDGDLRQTFYQQFPASVPYTEYSLNVPGLALGGHEVLEVKLTSLFASEDPPTFNHKLFVTAVELVLDYNAVDFISLETPITDYVPLPVPVTTFASVPEVTSSFVPTEGPATLFTTIPLS